MKYDDVMDVAGGFGVYQGMVFLLVTGYVLCNSDAIQINYIGYVQQHWCKVPELQNFTFSQQKDIAIPTNDQGEFDSCRVFDLDYSSYSQEDFIRWDRSAMVNNMTDTIDCVDWVFNRSMFTQNMVTRFNLVCGRSFQVQLVSTIYFLGVLVGSVVCGFVSDRFGRKLTIVGALIFKLGFGYMSVFAPNYATLVIGRFLMGIGATGVYLAIYVLLSEIVGKSNRALLGLLFQTVGSVGQMVISGFAYAIREDRWFLFVSQTAMAVCLLWIWLLPESPRWLILKGRVTDAEKVLKKITAVNGNEWPKDLDLSKLQDLNGPTIKQKSCGAMMHYPRMRTRTCIVDYHWFVDSLMYYAVTLNAQSLSGDLFVNTTLIAAVNIPAGLLSIACVNWSKMGRRLTCCLGLVIAGVCMFIQIPLILTDNDQGTRALSLISKSFTTIAFYSMYLYSAEIFPTETRNSGMGIASMFARISAMAASYAGGPLANVWRPLPPLIFGIFGLSGGLATLALPETLGYKLFDTIEEAEAHTAKRPYKETNEAIEIKNARNNKVGIMTEDTASSGLKRLEQSIRDNNNTNK